MKRKDYIKKKNKLFFEIEDCNKIRFNPKGDNEKMNETINKKKFQYNLLGAIMKNNK